jgi:hypothetical protein
VNVWEPDGCGLLMHRVCLDGIYISEIEGGRVVNCIKDGANVFYAKLSHAQAAHLAELLADRAG